MDSLQLFLGVPIDQALNQALEGLPPGFRETFIDCGDDYLKVVSHNQTKYIGKFSSRISEYEKLTLLEQNILSLLRKIVPNYSYRDSPLVLFPLKTQTVIGNKSNG